MAEAMVRPAFEVHKHKGHVMRTVYQIEYEMDEEGKLIRDDKGRKVYKGFAKTEVKEPFGFMVYFPQGHSIRCSEKELVKYGFHRQAELVDMETGERHTPQAQQSLKDLVEGRARRTVAINLDELVEQE